MLNKWKRMSTEAKGKQRADQDWSTHCNTI